MRRPPTSIAWRIFHFNPRTHVGCDRALAARSEAIVKISIHAPTWGATEAAHLPLAVLQFQSTHPRGVRPRRGWRPAPPSNFNPRTHVGCDFGKWFVKHPWNISIHAPTWGAPLLLVLAFPLAGISIHAPTWGATNSDSNVDGSVKFQSTHPRGVRLWRCP